MDNVCISHKRYLLGSMKTVVVTFFDTGYSVELDDALLLSTAHAIHKQQAQNNCNWTMRTSLKREFAVANRAV